MANHDTGESCPFWRHNELLVDGGARRRGVASLILQAFFAWHDTANPHGYIGGRTLNAKITNLPSRAVERETNEQMRAARARIYGDLCRWFADEETLTLRRGSGIKPNFAIVDQRFPIAVELLEATAAAATAALGGLYRDREFIAAAFVPEPARQPPFNDPTVRSRLF